jgi:Zn-dependent peptidase ImmA (M78 family)
MANPRIETLVRNLLKDHKVSRPPVPVETLATKLGAKVRYSPFDGDISGMVYRDEDRVIIGVNSLHHTNRQRFTIAHEIGHMLLHKGIEVHVDRAYRVNLRNDISSSAVDREEIEANRFAAKLLMPEHMLIADLKGQEIDFEDERKLEKLARRYSVSIQALTFRLTNLGSLSPA